MRRVIRIIAVATAILALVIASGAWIAGRWYITSFCFHRPGVDVEGRGDMGGIGIAFRRNGPFHPFTADTGNWPPPFGVGKQWITQPLWKDIYPPLSFYSGQPGEIWDWIMYVPYWFIVAVSLAMLGLLFWLARKRPHRYKAFPVLQT